MAQGDSIDIAGMHAEPCYAPSEWIHDHKHPAAIEYDGLAAEKVNAPQTAYRVPEEGRP